MSRKGKKSSKARGTCNPAWVLLKERPLCIPTFPPFHLLYPSCPSLQLCVARPYLVDPQDLSNSLTPLRPSPLLGRRSYQVTQAELREKEKALRALDVFLSQLMTQNELLESYLKKVSKVCRG